MPNWTGGTKKNPVLLVWLVGLAAAISVYLLGSDWLLNAAAAFGRDVAMLFDRVVWRLAELTNGVVRAVSVGLFVTFIGLSLLAIRAGHRGRMALVLVSAGFLWLVDFGGASASHQDWVEAMILAAAGALVMTQRLLRGGRP